MNLLAYTAPGGTHPGYVSINRNPNGDVAVTVREAPTVRDGAYVCGYKEDKGKPGRCTPGDDNCNNYCNMAPQKGLMQHHPLLCQQVLEGKSSTFVVPAAEWSL